MTKRLYYTDSTLKSFEASIVSEEERDGRSSVVLDRTAFYPTSGGQPHDVGTINQVAVADVYLDDGDEIHHVCEGRVGEPGEKVTGQIDWERRRQNCQNHTAQHILSSVFHRKYRIETVSVHLGLEYCAVEFRMSPPEPGMLREAERLANEMVADNCPIEIMFVEDSERENIPLRRPSDRSGRLRIVKIGEHEFAACGGTHCSSTGGVGLLKIIGVEKIRGRVRVIFLAGMTAIEDYILRHEVSDAMSKVLTCHPSELADRLASLQEQNRELKGLLLEGQRANLATIAEELTAASFSVGESKVVVATANHLDQGLIGQLAQEVASGINGLAVISKSNRITVATSDEGSLRAGELARKLADRTDFRGGGNERLANLGGGTEMDDDTLRSLIEEILSES